MSYYNISYKTSYINTVPNYNEINTYFIQLVLLLKSYINSYILKIHNY